jgi:hypothetical protein
MLSRLIQIAIGSFFFTAAVFFLISVFFVKDHDLDIDAFLYIGSRLWHGELLYFYDFETKLPPLQYLFSVPSALGGIGAWRLLTGAIAVLFGFWASHVLVKTLTVNDYTPIHFNQARLLCFSFFLLLLYSLPGSESAHLEMPAASAAFVSFALLLQSSAKTSNVGLFSSGLFLAVATCIRPNYVYILPVTYIYLFFFTSNVSLRELREGWHFGKTYLSSVAMVNFGFVVAMVILFSPYLLVDGGVEVLTDGLNAIASYSDSFGAKRLFGAQFGGRTLTFYLGLYFACMMLLIYLSASKVRQHSVLSEYAFMAVVSILAINASLLRNHYWAHNAIMFVPYTVPIFFLIFLSWFKNGLVERSERAKVIGRKISYVLFLLILATPVLQLLSYGRQVVKNRVEFNTGINDRSIDQNLLVFLRERRQSFLVIESPIYHMLLEERRIGDGHPEMLSRVLSGKRLGPIGNIDLYSDEVFTNQCLSLIRSGKELIIFSVNSRFKQVVSKCLDGEGSSYKKIDVGNLNDYQIFLRL